MRRTTRQGRPNGQAGLLARWALGASLAVFVGAVVYAVARFGLEAADQTASVVGGTIALISLPISLYALHTPPRTEGGGTTGNGGPAGREWVAAAAVDASLRPPAPVAAVRGRERELAVLEGLRRGGGMAVVCGAGGLGKTTLAAEAAQRAQKAGQAVFWTRWQNDPHRLAGDLTRVAEALGLPPERLEQARQGRAVLVDVVWEQLAAVGGWVVVVDNVDTPKRVGPGAEPVAAYRGWLRPDGAGLLVVTSRDTTDSTWGRRAQLVRLEPLEEAAGAVVLREAAPAAGSEEEARALAVRLGGLPLALEAAGRYLATGRYRTFTTYREALDMEFGDLLGAPHPQAATDPDIARTMVRHTWDLSLDQLHHDGYTLARPLLHLLALLEAAPIPLSLITPGLLADATGQDVTAPALDSALAGLQQYGLLDTPRTTPDTPAGTSAAIEVGVGVGQVVLHPLVREVMALTPNGTDLGPWYTALDARLAQGVTDTVQAGRAGWPTARLLAPHLPPLLDRAADQTFTTARDTLNALADTLHDAGASTEEHLLHQHVLEAETCRLGPHHPNTLRSRNNLASTLNNLGRHQEAADLHHQNLTHYEQTLGPHHPNTLRSRNNLANTLYELGRHQEAANLHHQNLTDHEQTREPHPDSDTLTIRNNLATALRSLGQHQEAADLHQQTLTDRERTLGSHHPHTLTSRNNLATALDDLGQHQEAANLHRQNLTDYERTLGPHHPDTLTSRNNLATALRSLGRHQEAADLLSQNLADHEQTFGPQHPHTLRSRNNLATVLADLGHHQQAADLHRQNLTGTEQTLGPHHPDTLRSRTNLAAVEAALAGAGRRRWWARRRHRGRP